MHNNLFIYTFYQADDDKVISGSYDLTLKVWDVRTGYCQQTLRQDLYVCINTEAVN